MFFVLCNIVLLFWLISMALSSEVWYPSEGTSPGWSLETFALPLQAGPYFVDGLNHKK